MGFLKIPLSQKGYNMKENREQSFLLQPSLSPIPAPQLDVKKTIWRDLKAQKQ